MRGSLINNKRRSACLSKCLSKTQIQNEYITK